MVKKLFQNDFKIPYSPWGFFLFFSLINVLLTYFSWSFEPKVFIILAGLILPFVLMIQSSSDPTQGKKPYFEIEPLSPWFFQVKVWFPILVLATLLRFWKCGSPDWWLGGDDSLMAWGAVDLGNHWRWMPFVTLGQDPTTLCYFCYFSLKIFNSMLLSFQIPPAVISWLTLVIAYPTAREYFSRSLSWILTGILALNYWSILIARPLLPGITLPLWELVVLYFMGRFLNSTNISNQRLWLCLLGFGLGLGPYTFFAWPVLFLLSLGTVGWIWWKKKSLDVKSFHGFLFFLTLSITPFLYSAGKESYGGYLLDVSAWNSFKWINQIGVIAGYLSGLFWGPGPVGAWPPTGGFLNFILSSFFFVGAVELYRFRKNPTSLFLAVAFILFLLPGILSHDVEFHRILLILPILFTISGIGLQSVLEQTVPGKRTVLFLGLFTILTIVDLFRIFQSVLPFHFSSWLDRDEQRISYSVLKQLADQKGPGFIFSDMIPNPMNLALDYCTYPFNAAWNPELPTRNINWAALFTESQYSLPLSRLFPQSKWVELPSEVVGVPSRHTLGLFAVTPQTLPRILLWQKYSVWNLKMNSEILNSYSRKSHQEILRDILQFYPNLPDDKYLQSCYFEKLLFNYSWEKTFHPEDRWANWQNFSPILRRSFEGSYQNASLCEKFGRLLAMEGDDSESRKIFQQALKLYPDNPWLQSQMRQLNPPDQK